MVEYALIIASMAGDTFRSIEMTLQGWAARVNWPALLYALLALVALKFVLWAFRPRGH
jgi:hypothetical protein